MMNQLTPEFAQWVRDYAAYLSGSEYGQSGNVPQAPDGIDEATAGYVVRLVGDGRRAGIAVDEHDSARADFARESVRKLRPLLRPHGICADTCFNVGYRSVREKGWTPARQV